MRKALQRLFFLLWFVCVEISYFAIYNAKPRLWQCGFFGKQKGVLGVDYKSPQLLLRNVSCTNQK